MYVVLLLFASLYSCILVQSAKQYDLEKAREYFENFTIKYKKYYDPPHYKEYVFGIFKDNLNYINRLNIEHDGEGEYGINQFTDLDLEDFLDSHTGHRNRRNDYDVDKDDLCNIVQEKDIPDIEVPESFDWREKDVVTPVKDQGECGSCWAFATSAYLESQYAIKYNKIIQLSEQQIMDCDKISDACCGSFSSLAFSAIIKNGGLNLEHDYVPYAADRTILPGHYQGNGVQVANCHLYKITSQKKVKQLLYKNGPIVTAIRATGLQHFEGRRIVTDEQCGKDEINHAVLLVGYGTENGKPYWILKNSWGTDFGENGFFKIERSENPDGHCGMLKTYLTTATIK